MLKNVVFQVRTLFFVRDEKLCHNFLEQTDALAFSRQISNKFSNSCLDGLPQEVISLVKMVKGACRELKCVPFADLPCFLSLIFVRC